MDFGRIGLDAFTMGGNELFGGANSGQGLLNNVTGATSQEEWTQQNMATAFGYDQQAYARQLTDQTNLANTAYQRQVADMKAAGLNPIMAAQQGGGAQTPAVKMDTPGAMPAPKGGSLLDLASTAMTAAGTAKNIEQANAQISNLDTDTQNKLWDNSAKQYKSEIAQKTKDAKIDAINATAQAAKSEAQREDAFNKKDMQMPQSMYWLQKLRGDPANSALKLLQILGE